MGSIVWVLYQISGVFQQCTNFESQLRFDEVTESLEVGTFLRDSVDVLMRAAKILFLCKNC